MSTLLRRSEGAAAARDARGQDGGARDRPPGEVPRRGQEGEHTSKRRTGRSQIGSFVLHKSQRYLVQLV